MMNFTNSRGEEVDVNKEYKKAHIIGWVISIAMSIGIGALYGTAFHEGYQKACKDIVDQVEDYERNMTKKDSEKTDEDA